MPAFGLRYDESTGDAAPSRHCAESRRRRMSRDRPDASAVGGPASTDGPPAAPETVLLERADREHEPADPRDCRRGVHAGEGTSGSGRMIEDARHFDHLAEREPLRMLPGRIQAKPEPVPLIGWRAGAAGLHEHFARSRSRREPPRREPAAVDIAVATDQARGDG